MIHRFNLDSRFISRIGLGLILLSLVILPILLPDQAHAQRGFTSTPTVYIPFLIRPGATLVAPQLLFTKSVPTVVVTNVRVLNLKSVQLADKTAQLSADLNYSDQFQASINVQSPSSMLIGESRVITLEVVPELLAQASMVRAELHAVEFESVDDGQPDKTVIENTPVSWNWNIAPKQVGQQEFFLALSYINNQGSRVSWQNITLQMTVSLAPSPTDSWTPAPLDTSVPTWTPSPTETPAPKALPTITPTRAFWGRVSDNISENPAPYLGTLVTLLLGLLGVYFQYIRRSDKESGGKKKRS
jgi:hypothetical protein